MATAFQMPRPNDVAEMLRGDLTEAEIPYRDEEDKVFDFHALRHQFLTNLANSLS